MADRTDADELTPASCAALIAIARLPEAWPLEDTLAESLVKSRIVSRTGVEAVTGQVPSLVEAGYLTRWQRGPDGIALVLTTKAALRMDLVSEEKWAYATGTRLDGAPGTKQRKVAVRKAVGVPRWARGETEDGAGRPTGLRPRRRRTKVGEAARQVERPVTPPVRAEEAIPDFLKEREAKVKRGAKRYRGKSEDGETTDDPRKAMRFFAGPDGGEGVPVEAMEPGKRNRVVERARRACAKK